MAASTVLPDRLPAPNTAVEVVVFPGAVVAFDERTNTAHELIGAPAMVFDGCRERLTTMVVRRELVEFGMGGDDEVDALLAQVLADLADLGLLEGCSAPIPPPCVGCAESTRSRFRRRGR